MRVLINVYSWIIVLTHVTLLIFIGINNLVGIGLRRMQEYLIDIENKHDKDWQKGYK